MRALACVFVLFAASLPFPAVAQAPDAGTGVSATHTPPAAAVLTPPDFPRPGRNPVGALPEALRPPPSSGAAEPRIPRLCFDRYTYWGIGIGAAAGLAYGLSLDEDEETWFSPVIEAAIGGGIGFYLGAAADIVRSLRSPPCRSPAS